MLVCEAATWTSLLVWRRAHDDLLNILAQVYRGFIKGSPYEFCFGILEQSWQPAPNLDLLAIHGQLKSNAVHSLKVNSDFKQPKNCLCSSEICTSQGAEHEDFRPLTWYTK
jgi:hypothetical protein